MKNKPAYAIDSVDHALHLATILLQEGELRITDAAERIGVSRSTAHRLLAMLVYRDFAEQDQNRRYVAGPIFRHRTATQSVAELRRVAIPRLRRLSTLTAETANLVVVVGDQARFVATIECDQVLRVGDREGRTLPAHLVSAGRAVLATWEEEAVRELHAESGSADAGVEALLRELRQVRRKGFAVNDQRTETGVVAIGCAVPSEVAAVPAGVSVAMPTARYRRDRLQEWVRAVAATAELLAGDLDWAASAAGRAR